MSATHKRRRCCFCRNRITGDGHSPAPIANGRCCNQCYAARVIPAHVALLHELAQQIELQLRAPDP